MIHSLTARLKSSSAPLSLTGQPNLTIGHIVSLSRSTTDQIDINLDSQIQERLNLIHQKMLEQVRSGTPIYGATTAYGAQAGRILTQGKDQTRYETAKALSNSIIHVDVSTGPILPDEVTKAAMLIRLNMLLPGYSAVRLSSLELLQKTINLNLIPQVGQFGTVGASGDLALNGRVLSMLMQRPETIVKDRDGSLAPANQVLPRYQLEPLVLEPKEGLGFVNGDNFSTAAAALLTYDLNRLMIINTVVAALNIQALRGSIRNFHPLLSYIRPHPGQKLEADLLVKLLTGSQLALQELSGHQPKENGTNVQDPYSIRCLPQYFGPDWETLDSIWKTVEINANSVSDNPLWTTPETVTDGETAYNWVSGGNFLAMHMADSLDKLRKIATHIVKQNDRHLNRLVNPHLNNGLPANLSTPDSVSQCLFKGIQTQMGMYEVYATVMAAPVSTAFGVHEELNQDITSHAMTSAIMTREVFNLANLAVASNLIAACQAIDLRGGPLLLSPSTRHFYDWLRQFVPFITTEQPLGHYVDEVAGRLLASDITNQALINLAVHE